MTGQGYSTGISQGIATSHVTGHATGHATGYATGMAHGTQQIPQSYTSNVSAWMPSTKHEIKQGGTHVETLAKDRVWTEYEAVQKTEYVPIERRAQDLYQIEHVTEMHPQVKYETKVDYVP